MNQQLIAFGVELGCALEANARGMVTLDAVLAKNAKRFKLKTVAM